MAATGFDGLMAALPSSWLSTANRPIDSAFAGVNQNDPMSIVAYGGGGSPSMASPLSSAFGSGNPMSGAATGGVATPDARNASSWSSLPGITSQGADFLANRAQNSVTFQMGADGQPIWHMPQQASQSAPMVPDMPQSSTPMPAAPQMRGYEKNPYLDQMAGGITQQFNNNLMQNILPSIRNGAAAVGGIGGSRQGIAEGQAIGQSNQGLSSALTNLYGTDYTNDRNRALQQYQADQGYALGVGGLNNQRYGMDQNFRLGMGGLANQRYSTDKNYDLGMGGLANQRYGMDQNYNLGLGGLDNQRYGMDQSFYTSQRGQDLQQYGLGLQAWNMGVNGAWSPLNNYTNMMSPYVASNYSVNQSGGASPWQNGLSTGLSIYGAGRNSGMW